MSELGNELRRLRQIQGLRLEDVAVKTGFTKAYLSDIERGRRGTIDATLVTLNRIFAVYGFQVVVKVEPLVGLEPTT